MGESKNLKIGDILVNKNIISSNQLQIALKSKRNIEPIGQTLVRLGYAEESEILPIIAEQLHISYVKIKGLKISAEIIDKVPAKIAHHYEILPVNFENNILKIAMKDPMDINTVDDLKLMLGYKIEGVLAGSQDIKEGLKKYYGVGADTVEKMMAEESEIQIETPKVIAEDLEKLAEDASIIRFVNQILLEAFKDRATDIHIEPFEEHLRVRFRIDGVMYNTSVPPSIRRFHQAIVSRIKVMANLNIAEHRLPQDGRIMVKVGGRELDLRVSILPTYYGETVNIRLLTVSNVLMGLEHLGLLEDNLNGIDKVITKPHGVMLVTGPTGSGKTTTLYACLNKLNTLERKIITIEDPIEYQLQGINQMQIQPKINFSFANGLRSMLRHDPDILMVGEIRDRETADITIRSALTGHFVFSTLHTNDAAGAVTRLIDMGVEPYLIASSVECIVAQRLVRVICKNCKTPVSPNPELVKELNIDDSSENLKLFEGKGCDTCKQSGFKGRTGIYEIIIINDNIRDLIMQKVPANIIKQKAQEQGMRTLRQDGWQRVLKGITTIPEVIKVTQEESTD